MSVALAVQLFSASTADGLQFYKDRKVAALSDADTTIWFVRGWNRIFDVLNNRHAKERIEAGSDDLEA